MNPLKPRIKRAARNDGEVTRARILEAAGQLFAEQGYAYTTSKAVCERAKTNLAAVNYHFGSRDNLFLSVLKAAHNHLINLDTLVHLASSPMTPRQKIERIIDDLLHLHLAGSWQVRLWAREILYPSPLFLKFLSQDVRQKILILHQIISDYIGIPIDSPTLHCCLGTMLAPCLVLLVASDTKNTTILPSGCELTPEKAAKTIKTFLLGGLEQCAASAASS